ncbi:MAG: polymerase sigma-70 factor [Chitinophagaceae bacterium]|nr:polymerase sigma-70 factor [Chitinophagaceae bacterium]
MEEGFKQCFQTYFERLHAYAYTIVKDNAEAKDIVQRAFLKLWEKRQEINADGTIKAYLYKTVYHLSLNAVRDLKTRQKHLSSANPSVINTFYDPSEEKELSARIRLGIENLPPRCREVFIKSRNEGKKYSEIAMEMDISVKTVEVQMGKALRLLRESLSDLLVFLICFFQILNL